MQFHIENMTCGGCVRSVTKAIQSVDPSWGGPIETIKQLAVATSASHEHHVVSIDRPSASFLREFPLEFTALGPAKVLGYSGRLTPWMRRHARDFDCVIIHGLWRGNFIQSFSRSRIALIRFFVNLFTTHSSIRVLK